MRLFLAGGTGVIGRPLIRQAVEAGHEVVATTRHASKRGVLRDLGATPVVLDALDREAVLAAVREAAPEAIVHQLTALPRRYRPGSPEFYVMTSRLRVEATRHLLEAAAQVGARRLVFQSICFMYELRGPSVLDETAPLAEGAPEPFGSAVRKTAEGERLVLGAAGVEGVVRRYGQLYGPATYFAADGDFARRAHRRMLPMVGDGSGVFSFLHVEDAAGAAVRALDYGLGVYNVADDEPAPSREWVPAYCASLGAPPPRRVPLWLARLLAGAVAAESMINFRGASNARAKAELGWAPRFPTWRTGFPAAAAGS